MTDRTSSETETLIELEQQFMHVLDGWEEDSSSPAAISALQYALGAVRDAMHRSRNAERCPTCKMTEEGYKRNLSWAGCTDRWHAGHAPPCPDLKSEEKLRLFLSILQSAGGETSGNDDKWNWINYFCDDAEPLDTFNQASKRKLTRVTHDSDIDSSMVYLTDAGRAFIASPDTSRGEK